MRFYFRPNWRFFALIALILLFTDVLSALAQDTTPPAATLTPTGIIAAFNFFIGTALVTTLVGLEKMFLPPTISADTLKEWTAVVIAALYFALVLSGHMDWFTSGSGLLEKLIPSVVGIIGLFQGSSWFHQVSERVNLPLVGYNRS